MDYSRNDEPWLDWARGPGDGRLEYVLGQYGNNPDWYVERAAQGGQGFPLEEGEAVSESGSEILAATLPSAFDAFAAEFGISERPDFPTITVPTTPFRYGGATTGTLDARDSSGSSLDLAVVEGPGHGTLSSEPVEVTFVADPGATSTTQPPATTAPRQRHRPVRNVGDRPVCSATD